MHREATNTYCNKVSEAKKEHWANWLEEATTKDVYTANKYISNPPSDYLNTRIPSLQMTTLNGDETMAIKNTEKSLTLTKTFFPPPPNETMIPHTAYPKPLQAQGYFARNKIWTAIQKLKPFKAPGVDGIQNVVLQKSSEMIINHLYYLFRAILEHNTYPKCWLVILTIVLHKPCKLAYNITKAYHPIGLLGMIGKLFSMLVVANIAFLAKKHNLLPPTQFSGRPSRCT